MTKKESNIILLSIVLCWSTSYIFIKDLPPDLSAYAYLAITTGIAGIIMLIIFHSLLRKINFKTILRGAVLAVLIAGTMLFEKLGLEHISSSAASFLFSSTIIIVPIILLLFGKLPTRNNVAGIMIILLGLLISTEGAFANASPKGILYILGGCILMSLYTVCAAEFTKKSEPLLLSVLQICFSAVIGFVLWFIEDPATFANITWSKQMLSSVFILAFFSKAYAYIMLMYAQKYADAIGVTIVTATDPVVTLILAFLIPNASGETESFSAMSLIGAIVIVLGAIAADLDFLSYKKKKNTVQKAVAEPPKESNTASVKTTDIGIPASGKRITLRNFLLTMLPFVVLGAAFKVMVLVEGLTEVRPANAIPVVTGLLFGPVGALGCAVGNLAADCFGTLNWTSVLGVVGNFIAAFIPHRVWNIMSKERPNVHNWKNILLFAWAACLGTLSCAWILGLGLELFFGMWIDTVYKYVLLNNIGFSLVLGLPVFILATSDSVKLSPYVPKSKKVRLPVNRKAAIGILCAETAVLLAIMVGVYCGFHLSNSITMCVLSAAAAVLTGVICVLKVKEK